MNNSATLRNFLTIFYIFLWLAIDTYPENLINNNFFDDYKKKFIALRFVTPYIFFLFFFYFFKQLKFQTDSKILNYIIYLLFLNFLIQGITLVIFKNGLNNLNYIFQLIQSFL